MKKKQLNKKIAAAAILCLMAALLGGCADGKEKIAETREEKTEKEESVKEEPADAEEPEETGEAEESEEDLFMGSTELMDYFGSNIDDLMGPFPALEIFAQEGSYTPAGAQYMDKQETAADGSLAGPWFDVDENSDIVGLSYSGTKYTVSGIAVGTPMQDAAAIAKKDGWTFRSVEYEHGTGYGVGVYMKDDLTMAVSSDAEAEFGSETEDELSGNVARVLVYLDNAAAGTGDGAGIMALTVATDHTDMNSIRNEVNTDGTYNQQWLSADGAFVLTNIATPTEYPADGQTLEDYAAEYTAKVLQDRDITVQKVEGDEALSAKLTYPAYRITWTSGSNEDSRQGVGVVILTDGLSFYCGYDCSLDDYEDLGKGFETILSDTEMTMEAR